MGPLGQRVAAIHGLVSGRPLGEVSLHDFPSMEYADNLFIAGGLGAYVRRLSHDLPVQARHRRPRHRLVGTRRADREFGRDASGQGRHRHHAHGGAAADAIRFAPALPNEFAQAIHGFTQGVYEHVVLHWPDSPFRGADRLASLTGTRLRPPGLLTRIDGAPFHFFELDQPTAAEFRPAGRRRTLSFCA